MTHAWCELCQKMAEILPISEYESCPGEIKANAERQAPAGNETLTCTVWNDVNLAAEVQWEHGSWRAIYPQAHLKLTLDSVNVHPQVKVRLRDDLNVMGMCTAVQGSTLKLSNSFGVFGDRAEEHVQKEATEAEEERYSRKQRQAELDKKLGIEVTQAILRKQKWVLISIFLCMLIFLAAMISFAVAAFTLVTELEGLGLAVGLLALWTLCCFIWYRHRAPGLGPRPELERYRVELEGDWRGLMASCICCAPLVSLGCLVAMTVAFDQNGSSLLSGVLWGPVALVICSGGVYGWRIKDGGFKEKARTALFLALIFPFLWPILLLNKFNFEARFAKLVLKPPKRSLDAAVHTTHEHTIVFEGNVLPKRETVCSWPGKYATAWDTLVAGSRQDDISAAVVFLPEGSEHYGFHDPIPARQNLQDLHGDCWCTPLYGEQKPWGCRWWSKWIANIELAVSQECTLVVYYFNDMKGQGKVKDFTTAGEEHVRREAIFRCKDAFLKSDNFRNALKAGLKHLSKEQGPDSSSPYSREVHRLFLATLLEEDRRFLEASEGLGNSQKAEVAWLERNGYPYIEKEVRELESSSPKAIGRATK